uniref:Uncharacterized protein n=1 Tax=Podoviridae sp. ct8Lf7 TaxID=2827723 RepID=A0A8S5S169_9CAUD|nr:MAG TPA: hypothetical protein [Podoviridae sp. ct8Lf7]
MNLQFRLRLPPQREIWSMNIIHLGILEYRKISMSIMDSYTLLKN